MAREIRTVDSNILEKGHADPNAAKVSEAFVSDLYILKPDGTYQVLNNNSKAFQELLNQHGAALHAYITRRYQPLYGEPTPAEWVATGRYKQVIIVTEIGTGKTAMAASILII